MSIVTASKADANEAEGDVVSDGYSYSVSDACMAEVRFCVMHLVMVSLDLMRLASGVQGQPP